MKHLWYSYLPLLAITALAVGLGFYQNNRESSTFSADSLEQLRTLNFEHQMTVKDLTAKESSPLVSELIHADVFLSEPTASENQGLIVTVDSQESDKTKILLLNPVETLSEVELQTLAEEYKSAVPEFEEVEVDQNLDLSSPFYDWDFSSTDAGSDAQITEEDVPVDLAGEEPIVVAVVDSGVDTSHEIFKDVSFLPGWNTIDENEDPYDDVGHGTHIAGIVASRTAGVEIVPYKIVGKDGGKLSNVLEALSRAIDDHVDVINTSFGVSAPSYSLEALIDDAYAQGIIVVSAAGNDDQDTGFYPASYDHTIAVASVDSLGNKLPKSNYGAWVDVAAYGYHVRSSLPGDEYGYYSGTSQATAFVSAAVARLLQTPHTGESWDFEQVLSALKSKSTDQVQDSELAGTPIVK